MNRIIKTLNNFRIVEVADKYPCMENLKGDSFSIDVNPDTPYVELKQQEKEFEISVEKYGVYGYILEKWNPEVGAGWEEVDSCWGFIGKYDPTNQVFNHYIVKEFENIIKGD